MGVFFAEMHVAEEKNAESVEGRGEVFKREGDCAELEIAGVLFSPGAESSERHELVEPEFGVEGTVVVEVFSDTLSHGGLALAFERTAPFPENLRVALRFSGHR